MQNWEPRVSDKLTIIVHEKMFEVITNSDCNLVEELQSQQLQQCWKGTRDVALYVEFIDGGVLLLGGHGTVGGD